MHRAARSHPHLWFSRTGGWWEYCFTPGSAGRARHWLGRPTRTRRVDYFPARLVIDAMHRVLEDWSWAHNRCPISEGIAKWTDRLKVAVAQRRDQVVRVMTDKAMVEILAGGRHRALLAATRRNDTGKELIRLEVEGAAMWLGAEGEWRFGNAKRGRLVADAGSGQAAPCLKHLGKAGPHRRPPPPSIRPHSRPFRAHTRLPLANPLASLAVRRQPGIWASNCARAPTGGRPHHHADLSLRRPAANPAAGSGAAMHAAAVKPRSGHRPAPPHRAEDAGFLDASRITYVEKSTHRVRRCAPRSTAPRRTRQAHLAAVPGPRHRAGLARLPADECALRR